ncbi:MAG: hypothetical protein BGP05_01015 [Rhizobiales bacterium 62-47]|nr:MAG: hypothetical protein BGP05_01015 [Rhizobiales bacterium 62-47]
MSVSHATVESVERVRNVAINNLSFILFIADPDETSRRLVFQPAKKVHSQLLLRTVFSAWRDDVESSLASLENPLTNRMS